MKGVLTAEPAILLEFKTVRIVLLVLCRVVISLLAFAANECYFHSHSVHLPVNLSGLPPSTGMIFGFAHSLKMSTTKNPPTEVRLLYHKLLLLSIAFLNFFQHFVKKYFFA